ncbi:MAG: adenine deaminase C-terminal domain-containing protein [Clostridia bacterium]|jgi:adenine deaminase|nr:amidohydrolase family protein [Clostridia bacterium]MDH7573080.1 adenine deaminase C-terminal domain-containing protein [Clostridia bacterium]
MKGQVFPRELRLRARAVALGQESPDLLVRDVTVLNVHTGTLLPHFHIATAGPLVAGLSRDEFSPGSQTVVLEGRGRYAIPGFIDAHAHLDEGVVTVPEFLRHALLGGTTAYVTDTAEVGNAFGCRGVIWFLESVMDQPAHVFALVSPMVPGDPQLLPGHRMQPEEVAELLRRAEVVGLGESYWTRVVRDGGDLLTLYSLAEETGKVAEGHGAGARKECLAALACCGIGSCHEAISPEEVKDRLSLGLFTIVREGSVRRDLEGVAALAGEDFDFRYLGLGTDGVNPVDLLRYGVMEYVVQKAIDLGFDPVRAVQMATINNATHFGLERYVGSISPGRYADFLLVEDLHHVGRPQAVVAKGRLVAQDGRLLAPPRRHRFPEEAHRALDFSRRFLASELTITAPPGTRRVRVRIVHQRNDVVTEEQTLDVPSQKGRLTLPPGINLGLAVSTLRPAKWSAGLISGWNLRAGACASSAVWDAPQVAGVGASAEELALAVNRVGEMGGGVAVCEGNQIVAELPLPIGGIISDLSVEEVAARMKAIDLHLRRLGYPYANPFLALRVMGYVGVPRLRLTACGLVRVGSLGGEPVPLML